MDEEIPLQFFEQLAPEIQYKIADNWTYDDIKRVFRYVSDPDLIMFLRHKIAIYMSYDISKIYSAALSGDLVMVIELFNAGAKLDSGVMRNAVKSGNVDLILWLENQGLKLNHRDKWIKRDIITVGSLELINLLHERGLDLASKKYMLQAIRREDLGIIEYLYSIGAPIDNDDIIKAVLSTNNVDIAIWFHDHGVNLWKHRFYNPLNLHYSAEFHQLMNDIRDGVDLSSYR